ncbi:calumenin-B-like [Oculina patagonica]
MFRVLSAFFVVTLCVWVLEVSASRLVYPQLRALQEKELSSKEHYKNEQHDVQYDHEAFLGQQTAQEWEQLPSDEVKEKLRALFPKIDIDKDNKVSNTELYEWIEQHMRKHVLRGADMKLRDIDTDKDGKVSWEEYKESEFPPSTEEGLNEVTLAELREIESRDKKRFEFSDTDNDNLLSREELTLFLHPEESKRMTSYLIEENMDVFDRNKDGKVSLEEYLGEGVDSLDKSTADSLSNSFKKELDLNQDGYLDKNEIRHWILPGVDEDPIQSETNHLMKLGDDNKDTFLSVEELVKHYRDFAGSRVTRYGDLLKEEL